MHLKVARGRIIVSTRKGRFRSYGLPRWTTVVPLAAIAMILILLNGRTTSPYLGAGMRDRNVMLAAQAVPAFAGTVGVALRNVVHATPPPDTSALPTLHVVVPRNTLDDLERALVCGDKQLRHDEGGNKPYFKAWFVDEFGDEHKSKICIRGTMDWHHSMAKPSLRIRISKSHVTQRQRYVELSRPEDALAMVNWLPLDIAPELGLITCQPDHVRLFINRKYFGVYERSMRQGEPMALANHRMPGTFFKGDNGVDMWQQVNGWRMTGEVAPGDVTAFGSMLQLVARLQTEPDAEALEELWKVLDFERYARWAALMTVTGSLHTDDIHNQSFFFCSNQGLVEPVPWDPNSFRIHAIPDVPPDTIKHPIMTAVTRDPRWVHRRNYWIARLLDSSCSAAALVQRMDNQLTRLMPDLNADRTLGQIVRTNATDQMVPISVADLGHERQQLVNWFKQREQFLQDYLGNARITVSPGEDGSTQVAVWGNVAVTAIRGTHRQTLYPGLGERLGSHVGYPYEGAVETQFAPPAPLHYTLEGGPEEYRFENAITNEVVGPSAKMASTTAERSVHPTRLTDGSMEPIRLGPGIIEVTENLITNPGQPLIVEAGTYLCVHAGVGIYCRGRTELRGTSEEPIWIRPHDDNPFTCMAIAGEHSAGSFLHHVHIAGGSVGQLNHQRFKGMLSVYDCPQFKMDNCRIGENKVGDDAVNLAESRVTVTNCRWTHARADALDLDMVEGTVSNCRWHQSGNDALDLMNCRVRVRDCLMHASGDKGISVGEDTQLIAERVTLSGCVIGIECKDASRALLKNCWLTNNATGAHAYQKKWFFSRGGSAAFVNCRIEGGMTLLDAKQKSSFVLVGSTCPTEPLPKRVTRTQSLPASWSDLPEAEHE